jgi:hypothetical protein
MNSAAQMGRKFIWKRMLKTHKYAFYRNRLAFPLNVMFGFGQACFFDG